MKIFNNEKRSLNVSVYEKIWKTIPTSPICSSAECRERCCEPDYSRYGVFDYFLLLGSDVQIERKLIDVPPLLPGTNVRIFKSRNVKRDKPCSLFIANRGCSLAEGDRPIICVIWSCEVIKNNMNKKLVKELKIIERQYNRLKWRVVISVFGEILHIKCLE